MSTPGYRAVGEAGPPILKPVRIKTAPKPMNKVNPERRALLHERNYGAHGDFIRTLPCIVSRVHPSVRTACEGRVVCAHFDARGMGGCGGDRFSTFPCCVGHHDEQGAIGITSFQERYDLDLALEVEAFNLADPGLTDDEREAARLRLQRLREAR